MCTNNASLALLSHDDSSRILARIGNDFTRTSEQDGRRQDDNYDDEDGGEYYAYDNDSYQDSGRKASIDQRGSNFIIIYMNSYGIMTKSTFTHSVLRHESSSSFLPHSNSHWSVNVHK